MKKYTTYIWYPLAYSLITLHCATHTIYEICFRPLILFDKVTWLKLILLRPFFCLTTIYKFFEDSVRMINNELTHFWIKLSVVLGRVFFVYVSNILMPSFLHTHEFTMLLFYTKLNWSRWLSMCVRYQGQCYVLHIQYIVLNVRFAYNIKDANPKSSSYKS